MLRKWCTLAVLVAAPVARPICGQQATVSDSARLQGAWSMVSGAADGTSMPPSDAARMRRVFDGSTVTVTMAGGLYFRATIVLDAATTPKHIDYHMTGGFTTGATQLGIYEIRGDTVRFAFASPNAARPTDFTSQAGDGRTVSTWVRAKR